VGTDTRNTSTISSRYSEVQIQLAARINMRLKQNAKLLHVGRQSGRVVELCPYLSIFLSNITCYWFN